MKTPPIRRSGKWLAGAFILCAIGSQPTLFAREAYWVPPDPPKSRYVIDARLDLSPSGAIEGTETIVLRNTSRRPLGVVAFDWAIGPASSLTVTVLGKALNPRNPENRPALPSPTFFNLPKPVSPGQKVRLDVRFKKKVELPAEAVDFGDTRWYPRLWWDGRSLHDSFSVKLDIPAGFALAASGRLNPRTGRYDNDGARTFGIYLGKNMKVETRESDGVLITAVATEKGAKAASACLETAVDVVKFSKDWLGFYPFPFLNIIPGGSGRWGGYPFATGIVVIHGQETCQEGEPLLWWQHITSHEIGHEYWGEWVLDPDEGFVLTNSGSGWTGAGSRKG